MSVAQQPTLKVMRMSAPSLHTTPALNLAVEKAFPVTPYLTLPSSFGVLHLGEVFKACICVSDVCGPTQLKVDMLVGGVSTELATKQCDASSPTLELLVQAEIQQLGPHALMCSLSWNNASVADGLRKTYKFESQHPLSVKTKFHKPTGSTNSLDVPDVLDGWLEVQVSNISTAEIYVQSMHLLPSSGYTVRSIHTEEKGHLLQIKDTFQYAFEIQHSGSVGNDWGKLDIRWITAMGERGRLMTAPLLRKAPPDASTTMGQIKIIPTFVPSKILLFSHCSFKFKLVGISGPLKLQHLDPALVSSDNYSSSQTPPATPRQAEQSFPKPIPSRPLPKASWADPLGLGLVDINEEFTIEYFFSSKGVVRLPPIALYQGHLKMIEISNILDVWVDDLHEKSQVQEN